MDELLQEMRENLQVLMEAAEVLENQIARLKEMNPQEARQFLAAYQKELEERNIAVQKEEAEQTPQKPEEKPLRRKRSVKTKI